MQNILLILPLLIFLLVCASVAFALRRDAPCVDFPKEFFAGNYSVGRLSFISLFISLLLTFAFIVLIIEAPAEDMRQWGTCALILFGALLISALVCRKRIIRVARRVDAITLLDILEVRFHSNLVTIVVGLALVFSSGISLVLSLAISSYLFSYTTGFSPSFGLLLIAVTVITVVAVAGLRGAATVNVLAVFTFIGCFIATAVAAFIFAEGDISRFPLRLFMLFDSPPSWAHGLLALAALAPGIALSCSALLVTSALFVKNLLLGHCEAHNIAVTRKQARILAEALTIAIGVVAMTASFLPLPYLLFTGLPFIAMLFLPSAAVLVLGLYWEKTNLVGILIGYICSFLACGILFNVIEPVSALLLTAVAGVLGTVIGSALNAKPLCSETKALFFDKE